MTQQQDYSAKHSPAASGPADVCFRQIVESTPDAVIIFDGRGRIQFWNSAATELFGVGPADAIGESCIQLVWADCETDFDSAENAVIEVQLETKLHGPRWCEVRRTRVDVDGESWGCDFLRDCHDRKLRELSWMHEAKTDSLTGIANRGEFQRQLELNLEGGLCLAILDLDRFKHINDSRGHLQGDDALQFVSSCLRSELEDPICIGRLGGDEFGFLLADVEPDEFTQVCERVRRRICEGEGFADHSISVSIGGVCCSNAGSTPRELLTVADKMLYEAKALGRNVVRTKTI